ncbi:MAG: hypothetical protein WCB51_15145 [Candidatus Dormiibacterota bacterium]
MPLRKPPFLISCAVAAATLAACGGSSATTTPTPTPLSQEQIQARYTAAATAYNASEAQIALTQNAACDVASPTAALTACQTAFSAQRQATIAYDNALRATPFSGTAATDASHLLSDDAAIEALLEQAATAPSLATIASVQAQIVPLLATAAAAAAALRADIGLKPPA